PWKLSFSSDEKSYHYPTAPILIYSSTFYPIFRDAL
ncbi:MAG: hypothetical protein ACI8PD_001439, partial [Nitrospinales bacterium]